MRRLILAAALFLLAACAQPPVPDDHFYRLAVNDPAPGAQTLKGALEVQRFSADGVTAARPIAFSKPEAPGEFQAYHYHFWTEPPTVLLQNKLVEYLRAARLAASVVTPELRIAPQFVLTGRIKRFERILAAPPRVMAEIELGLKEERTDRLIHLATYRAEEQSSGKTVAHAALALGRATARIYGRFLADVRGKR